MMLFHQKSVVIAATVALLAIVASNNNNNHVMVSAQAEDKDDKDDAMEEGPVVINMPGRDNDETMVPSSNGTSMLSDDDELELPFAGIADNITDLFEDIIDAIFDGCECEGTVISCSDPEDATMCMCEADGTVVCQDEPVDPVAADDDFDPMFDVEPVTEAPGVAPEGGGASTTGAAPVGEPVAMDPQEPDAPDTDSTTATTDADAATSESEASAMTSTNTVVTMVLSAAGLVAVALN